MQRKPATSRTENSAHRKSRAGLVRRQGFRVPRLLLPLLLPLLSFFYRQFAHCCVLCSLLVWPPCSFWSRPADRCSPWTGRPVLLFSCPFICAVWLYSVCCPQTLSSSQWSSRPSMLNSLPPRNPPPSSLAPGSSGRLLHWSWPPAGHTS